MEQEKVTDLFGSVSKLRTERDLYFFKSRKVEEEGVFNQREASEALKSSIAKNKDLEGRLVSRRDISSSDLSYSPSPKTSQVRSATR